MKRIITLISVTVTSVLFSVMTIIAADKSSPSFEKYESLLSSHTKNECLLVAKNCATDTSTVQQRVNDLRNEIAKGLKVYTPTELNILKEQLKWIESNSNEFI